MINKLLMLILLFVTTNVFSYDAENKEMEFKALIVSLKESANNNTFSHNEAIFYQEGLLPTYRYADANSSDLEHKEILVSQAQSYFSDHDYLETVDETYTCNGGICEYRHFSSYKDSAFKDVTSSSQRFKYENGAWSHINLMYPTLEQLKDIVSLNKFYTLYFAFKGLDKMSIYVNEQFVYQPRHSAALRLFAMKKGENTIRIVLDDKGSILPEFHLGISVASVDRANIRAKMDFDNIVGGVIVDGFFDKRDTKKVQYVDGGLVYKFTI